MSNPLSERLEAEAKLRRSCGQVHIVQLLDEAAALARRVEGYELAASNESRLAESVLAWWNEHESDSIAYDAGDGYMDERNLYDEPPEFVKIAYALVPVEGETPPSTEGGKDGSR